MACFCRSPYICSVVEREVLVDCRKMKLQKVDKTSLQSLLNNCNNN